MDILKYKFHDMQNWPGFVNKLLQRESWFNTMCKKFSPLLSKAMTEQDSCRILNRLVDFSKTRASKMVDLEMINNEVWAVVKVTPEVLLAILKYSNH